MSKNKSFFAIIALFIISLTIFFTTTCSVPSPSHSGSGGSGGGNTPPSTDPVNITGEPSVTLPAGYDANKLSIDESAITLPSSIDGGFKPIGKTYDITYDGGSVNFAPDFAELKYSYDNDDLSAKSLLNEFVVFYYDTASSSWKRVDKTYANLANNEVTAETGHFTTFVLTAMPVSTGTTVTEAPANIYDDYPSGIGGSCGADFTIIDENFKYYMDRDYYVRPTSTSAINTTTFNALGFYGALGIATANGYSGSGINLGPQSAHKLYTGDDYITFTAHKDLDVYVMYDTRGGLGVMDISEDAPWLASEGFTADITTTAIPTPTRYFIETTDAVGRYTVYRKSYNMGEVVHLHGNRKGVTDPAINTNYWIILKSKGVYTDEPAATMASSPDTTPPANVTGLTASVSSGSITLSWTNPADADFAGVVIRKSTTAFPLETNEGIEPVGAELSETSYRDDDVSGVTTYYYTVFALDTNQNYQSGGTTILVNYNDSEINVVQGATDIASGDTYDFGDILVGDTSGNITFTIQNTGTSDLSISSVVLSGTSSDQFTLNDSSTASTVSSGSSTTFTLSFNPDSLGTKNALITITNGDSDEGTYTINITGRGVAPEINVQQSSTSIPDGGSYDFGGKTTGTSTTVTFSIQNTGTSNESSIAEIENGFIFTFSHITYRIIGNFYEHAMSLKVNIKAVKDQEVFINSVDLYKNRERQNFIIDLMDKFGFRDHIQLENDLAKIIEVIENHKEEKIKESREEKLTLTDSQKEIGLTLLTSPHMLSEIENDISILGYVNERKNKILTYLVMTSRLMDDPLHTVVVSRSSAGKSRLIDITESLCPKHDLKSISDLTSQALYYVQENELKNKFVVIGEKEGSRGSEYPLRELISKKSITKSVPIKDPVTGLIKTVTIKVNGPISLAETTSSSELNSENLNRCFIISVDESEEQTKQIQKSQRFSDTLEGHLLKQEMNRIIEKHHSAQMLLKNITVINPFASFLTFPTHSIQTRRDHMKFLKLIKVITFLHQYQRETKCHKLDNNETLEYIESTIDDYRVAYELLIDGVLDNSFDDLAKPVRELLEIIKSYLKERSSKDNVPIDKIIFTRKDIRDYSNWTFAQVRNNFQILKDYEYLQTIQSKNGLAHSYKLVSNYSDSSLSNSILTPDELEEKINLTDLNKPACSA